MADTKTNSPADAHDPSGSHAFAKKSFVITMIGAALFIGAIIIFVLNGKL